MANTFHYEITQSVIAAVAAVSTILLHTRVDSDTDKACHIANGVAVTFNTKRKVHNIHGAYICGSRWTTQSLSCTSGEFDALEHEVARHRWYVLQHCVNVQRGTPRILLLLP